jgi:hypothetical protein
VVTTVEETTAEGRHVVAGVVGLSIPTPAFGDQANRCLSPFGFADRDLTEFAGLASLQPLMAVGLVG